MKNSCNQVQNKGEFVQDWQFSPPFPHTRTLKPHGFPSISARTQQLLICGCLGSGHDHAYMHTS